MDYGRIDPETVLWATDNARQLLLQENERVSSIDGKSAQLAGFGGVILAVLGSVAPEAFDRGLGSVGNVAFATFYFLAATTLTASLLWLVLWVLRPTRFIAVDANELDAYLEDDRLLRAKPWALQIRTLRALRDAAKWAQEAAEQKAARLTVGVGLFAAGLFSALAAVVTLGIGSL